MAAPQPRRATTWLSPDSYSSTMSRITSLVHDSFHGIRPQPIKVDARVLQKGLEERVVQVEDEHVTRDEE